MEFFSIPVQTECKGKKITGTLRGTLIYWEFESYSKYFVECFPNHLFTSRTTLKDKSEATESLVEALLTAFDNCIAPILV